MRFRSSVGRTGPRARLSLRAGRHDRRGGRGAGADPGPGIPRGDGRPVRRDDPGSAVRPPVRGPGAGGRAGARVPERLHRRARLRDLPVRRDRRRDQAVERRPRGRPAARAAGDRALPHPPHRGRHPRVRLRHVVRHQPVRGRHGLHLDGRPRPGSRLRRQAGPAAHQGPKARGASWSASRSTGRRSAPTSTTR